jgi:hypothetical protein
MLKSLPGILTKQPAISTMTLAAISPDHQSLWLAGLLIALLSSLADKLVHIKVIC